MTALMWLIADLDHVNTKKLIDFNAPDIPSVFRENEPLLLQWSQAPTKRGLINYEVKDNERKLKPVQKSFEQLLRISYRHASKIKYG